MKKLKRIRWIPAGFRQVVWPVSGIVIILLIGLLIFFSQPDDTHILAASEVLQACAIICGAWVISFGNFLNTNASIHATRRRSYQELELAAVDLFRFEIDHPDLIKLIWVDDNDGVSIEDPPASGGAPSEVVARDLSPLEEFMVIEYVSQLLCLFELAVRYREEDIVPDDVFASWLPWIYELCGRPTFVLLWKSYLREHYVPQLRRVIDDGIKCQEGQGNKQAFFVLCGERFDCDDIRNWLKPGGG